MPVDEGPDEPMSPADRIALVKHCADLFEALRGHPSLPPAVRLKADYAAHWPKWQPALGCWHVDILRAADQAGVRLALKPNGHMFLYFFRPGGVIMDQRLLFIDASKDVQECVGTMFDKVLWHWADAMAQHLAKVA